jgi:hypothetical protein
LFAGILTFKNAGIRPPKNVLDSCSPHFASDATAFSPQCYVESEKKFAEI